MNAVKPGLKRSVLPTLDILKVVPRLHEKLIYYTYLAGGSRSYDGVRSENANTSRCVIYLCHRPHHLYPRLYAGAPSRHAYCSAEI